MRRIAIALSLALAGGCAAHTAASGSSSGGAARVVTLVPSFADDVYALGAGAQLVAVSAFTDAPQAKHLPRIADAGSVDAEAILALRPTLVIGIPAQARLTDPLRRARVRVVLLADDTFAQIFENLALIGTLTNHVREARATIGRLRRETAALHARTASFRRHPALFLVLGSGPIWTAGAFSYISTLVELAGGTNAASDLHAAYGEYSAEALLRRQPDLLVADPATNLGGVLDREPWRSLRAVREQHLYYVAPDLIERPGPNYNAGLQWLLERIAPLAERAR
ncbi:MAG TPA: helical backbone metal receptor [Candidatus Nitrosotalea sp.]|nr:helical backbone metal receptor [Candidatus Nitrosotalea sp.]